MGCWQHKFVFIRDFAYPPRPRLLRMASENIGDVPASSFAELLSGPVVDIYVGEARQHWSVHRNLLCHHSDWFADELLPSEENKKPPVELSLPKDDPVGFELLVKWLYQGKLESVSDMPDPYRKYDFAVACHKLYLLCDRFEMAELKNMAMDQYRRGLSQARLVPDPEEIDEIYRRSAPGSPFRQLMARIAARQIMDPDNDKDATQYQACFSDNPEFAIDLVNAIRKGAGGVLLDDPTEGDECTYHDHEDGPNCNVKGKARQAHKASSRALIENEKYPPRNALRPVSKKAQTPSPEQKRQQQQKARRSSSRTSLQNIARLPLSPPQSPPQVPLPRALSATEILLLSRRAPSPSSTLSLVSATAHRALTAPTLSDQTLSEGVLSEAEELAPAPPPVPREGLLLSLSAADEEAARIRSEPEATPVTVVPVSVRLQQPQAQSSRRRPTEKWFLGRWGWGSKNGIAEALGQRTSSERTA